jgi:co-chaperonin GroES (HSP10)
VAEKCVQCGNLVQVYSGDEGTNSYELVDKRLAKVIDEFKIPFVCQVCGGLWIGIQAVRDVVFVWPDPPKDKTEGGIVIPEKFVKDKGYGTVLSVGPGHWSPKKQKYYPTGLKRGDRVVYNKNVPWRLPVKASDGRVRMIPYMGEQDVLCLVLED